MKFQPLAERILIREDVKEDKELDSGIILTGDQVSNLSRVATGTVVAIGEGYKNFDGSLTPLKTEVGNRIAYPKMAGEVIDLEDEEVRCMPESQVIGIFANPYDEEVPF